VEANRETKLDQFVSYMKKHSTVQIVDLRPALLAAKATAPTYLQKDTHWNLFGAFVGAETLVKELASISLPVPLLEREDFDLTNTPATGGDLAQMQGSDAREANFFSFLPKPFLTRPTFREEPRFPTSFGPRRVVTLQNITSLSNPTTIVVFHDSFGLRWHNILGYPFKRTVFLDDNRCFSPMLIDNVRPQIVISEMVERGLNTGDPEQMMAHDSLP
jgi:hypothetical protein